MRDERITYCGDDDVECDRVVKTTFLNNTLFLTPITHRYGNCDVPNSWPENQPLSYWVSKQRQQYKLYGRQGAVTCHLTEERVNELNDVGFDWRYPILLVAPKNGFVPPLLL